MNDVLKMETGDGGGLAASGAVVTIPEGVPGFERCRRYVVVTAPTLEPFVCLQGLDDTKPSFLTLDPRLVVDGFAGALSASDRVRLDARADDPLLWMSIVRLDDNRAYVNLAAPIVINPRRMVGLQVIDGDLPYSSAHVVPLD